MYKNIIFDFGGVVVDFNPRNFLMDRFMSKHAEEIVYDLTFGSQEWLDLDRGTLTREAANEIMLENAAQVNRVFEVRTVIEEWKTMLHTKKTTVKIMKLLKKNGYRLYYLTNIPSDVMDELETLDVVGPCLSPFDFVTVQKRGTRLALTPISPVQDGEEWTEESAQIFKERLLSDDMARNYLYSEDGNTIMLYYRTGHYNQAEQDVMNAIIDPLRDYGRVAINGGSTITNRVTYFIFKDLGILLSLCLVVILLVYYLSYKSLRAVLIPSSLSIISIIWTLGTMSLRK